MRSLRDWTYYPITTRQLVVLRTQDVTPGMRRVTLGGPGLAAHTAPNGHPVQAFRSDGFDDEFKLFLKHPEEPEALVPTQLHGVLDWPRDPHLVSRTYTVRRWDPDAGEVDVDLVLHGAGPAVQWATSVQVGERVQVAGPKMSGSHPAGADWCLIVGDETALPAIARWLEEFPAGGRGQVFIEVMHASHQQALVVGEGVELTWVCRDEQQGGTGVGLLAAVQAAEWWPGTVFAWAAGESTSLTPLRRWLRDEKGLAKPNLDITGYWRRTATEPEQAPGLSASSSADSDHDASTDHAAVDLHERAEIVGPVALRAAITIGLGRALAGEPRTIPDLAAETGTDDAALGRLLRYLEAVGLADRTDADGVRYAWADAARELDDDWYDDTLSLVQPDGLRSLGILGLLHALRTGRGLDPTPALAAWGIVDAGTSAGRLADQLDAEARQARYLAGPLAGSSLLDGCSAVRISGRGAAEIALAIRREHPDLEVRVLTDTSQAAAMRDLLAETPVMVEDNGLFDIPAADLDLHLLVDLLDHYPDDAAVALLQGARAAIRGGQVVLVGEALDAEALDEHECEDDLVLLASGGAGLRTRAEREEVVRRAGLQTVAATSVGWGFDVQILS